MLSTARVGLYPERNPHNHLLTNFESLQNDLRMLFLNTYEPSWDELFCVIQQPYQYAQGLLVENLPTLWVDDLHKHDLHGVYAWTEISVWKQVIQF